jgi:pyridoxal phosphate enzyme (YggS family)
MAARQNPPELERSDKQQRMANVRENYVRILERLHAAAARTGRLPEAIQLIAVTKTVPPARMREAIEAGVRHIGENRLQEALPKREALHDAAVTWHFIGHLQTNKAKKVAENFDWVQCVDRPELAEKLNEAATKPLPVLIEVNVGGELSKSGIDPQGLKEFVRSFKKYERLSLRGLMTIPPFLEGPEEVRPYFRKLRQLAEQFALPDLSMGMSHDFEVAVEEGATMVRIGTSLFGERRHG